MRIRRDGLAARGFGLRVCAPSARGATCGPPSEDLVGHKLVALACLGAMRLWLGHHRPEQRGPERRHLARSRGSVFGALAGAPALSIRFTDASEWCDR